MKSQWWERSTIESLQGKKLAHLVDVARAHAEHYAACTLPDEIPGGGIRSRLEALPVLTKSDIRSSPAAMRTDARMDVFARRVTTGGTTGTPIEIWRNMQDASIAEAAYWRAKAWRGIAPWDKGVLMQQFGKGSWYGKMRMRLIRKWDVEAFCSNETERLEIRVLLDRVRPAYLEGCVTELLRLGEGRCLEPGRVGCVFTTGEMLYDDQRAKLEGYCQAPVSDYYGSNEVNSIAFECEEGVKHVTDEHVILETVNEKNEPVLGIPGRILVTDLDNVAMPLIRYELGDIGVLSNEPCACGRKLTVLKELRGRTQEAIRNRAGESLSATYFAGRFRELQCIRRFQLIQTTLDEVRLDYEVATFGAEQEVVTITREIKARLGAEITVRAREVPEVKVTPRGKCPLIIGLKNTGGASETTDRGPS